MPSSPTLLAFWVDIGGKASLEADHCLINRQLLLGYKHLLKFFDKGTHERANFEKCHNQVGLSSLLGVVCQVEELQEQKEPIAGEQTGKV